ncbi:MAG: hypothetical protein U5L95_05025 [Candidatus Saccharibacteria bacterium]|nr:hypothetical protein [Candidatus Saccharibacteria bacterium]
MSTEEEFELTFLASRLPSEIKNKDAVEYSDIYIPEDADFPVLRLRKKGENFELTKKVPIVEGDYSKHVEDTIVLSKSEFQSLKKSSNRKVEKLRYSFQNHGILHGG